MNEVDLFRAYGLRKLPATRRPYAIKCQVPGCMIIINQLETTRLICRFHLKSGWSIRDIVDLDLSPRP